MCIKREETLSDVTSHILPKSFLFKTSLKLHTSLHAFVQQGFVQDMWIWRRCHMLLLPPTLTLGMGFWYLKKKKKKKITGTNLLGKSKMQPLAPVHFPVVQVSLQWEIWRHKPPLNLSASVPVALLVVRERKWPPLAAGNSLTKLLRVQVQASKFSSANHPCRLCCITR